MKKLVKQIIVTTIINVYDNGETTQTVSSDVRHINSTDVNIEKDKELSTRLKVERWFKGVIAFDVNDKVGNAIIELMDTKAQKDRYIMVSIKGREFVKARVGKTTQGGCRLGYLNKLFTVHGLTVGKEIDVHLVGDEVYIHWV